VIQRVDVEMGWFGLMKEGIIVERGREEWEIRVYG
jgi:hypothetical protein